MLSKCVKCTVPGAKKNSALSSPWRTQQGAHCLLLFFLLSVFLVVDALLSVVGRGGVFDSVVCLGVAGPLVISVFGCRFQVVWSFGFVSS